MRQQVDIVAGVRSGGIVNARDVGHACSHRAQRRSLSLIKAFLIHDHMEAPGAQLIPKLHRDAS